MVDPARAIAHPFPGAMSPIRRDWATWRLEFGSLPMRVSLISLFLLLGAPIAANADPAHHTMIDPDALDWAPVASLPAGAEVTVIEGPMNEPGPFTARLRFPANYRLPAHWHPVVERVTVLSGRFHMGLGDRLDTRHGNALAAGAMMLLQPETRHYAWTEAEPAVVQLHGTGPWQINYVNPADDPRTASR
jgi:hypothetical protein